MSDVVEIRYPPVSVVEMEGRIERGSARLLALWSSGRLQNLLEDAEGRLGLQIVEDLRGQLTSQWTRAAAAGAPTLNASLALPRDSAPLVVAIARRLVALLADPMVMQASGTTAISSEDVRFWSAWIDVAQETILAQRSVT